MESRLIWEMWISRRRGHHCWPWDWCRILCHPSFLFSWIHRLVYPRKEKMKACLVMRWELRPRWRWMGGKLIIEYTAACDDKRPSSRWEKGKRGNCCGFYSSCLEWGWEPAVASAAVSLDTYSDVVPVDIITNVGVSQMFVDSGKGTDSDVYWAAGLAFSIL